MLIIAGTEVKLGEIFKVRDKEYLECNQLVGPSLFLAHKNFWAEKGDPVYQAPLLLVRIKRLSYKTLTRTRLETTFLYSLKCGTVVETYGEILYEEKFWQYFMRLA